jgi:hypothetical protein
MNKSSETFYYKTVDPSDYTMIIGGDLGINPESRSMNEMLLDHNADLIMIGGDISYDNNFPQWYRATDQILKEVPHALKRKSKGYTRLVPMIKASGNHDFGTNANSRIAITHNQYEPLFKHYYPQSSQSGNIPLLAERKSYFYHLVAPNTLVISLDSGYDTSADGDQTAWLSSVLSKYSQIPVKIVQYHEPIYQACNYPLSHTQKLWIENWVPLFEKYNVTVVFENHNHSLKRTHKLRQGKVDPTGVLYLGDGSWGALDNGCDYRTDGIIAHAEPSNHVWFTNVQTSNNISM